jgi:hypothetical protein
METVAHREPRWEESDAAGCPVAAVRENLVRSPHLLPRRCGAGPAEPVPPGDPPDTFRSENSAEYTRSIAHSARKALSCRARARTREARARAQCGTRTATGGRRSAGPIPKAPARPSTQAVNCRSFDLVASDKRYGFALFRINAGIFSPDGHPPTFLASECRKTSPMVSTRAGIHLDRVNCHVRFDRWGNNVPRYVVNSGPQRTAFWLKIEQFVTAITD